MSVLPELVAVLFFVLYSVRDFLFSLPLFFGNGLAWIIQWIINSIPLP